MSGWGSKPSGGSTGGGGSGNPDLPDSVVLEYQQVSGVAASVLTTVLSYTTSLTVPTQLVRCQFGGTNISQYWLYVDGALKDRFLTRHNLLTGTWELGSGDSGVDVGLGQLIEVKAIHTRPYSGDFWARISLILVDN